jgi:hypothetical protein
VCVGGGGASGRQRFSSAVSGRTRSAVIKPLVSHEHAPGGGGVVCVMYSGQFSTGGWKLKKQL